MTRARDQVFLLYQNDPSEFLRVMEGEIIFRVHPAAFNTKLNRSLFSKAGQTNIHSTEICAIDRNRNG